MRAGFNIFAIIYILCSPVYTLTGFEVGGEVFNDTLVRENDEFNITAMYDKFPIDLWTQNGFFKKDYLKKINPLWIQAGPQSYIIHYCLAAFYVLFMLVGATGNVLVIYMSLRFESLRTPSLNLVLNLAVSDLLMMLKMPMFVYNSIYEGPALGETACRIYGFIGGLSGTCSICTIAAIALDRYYVVKYPLNLRFTSIRSKICVVICWAYAFTFSIIPLLEVGLGEYTPEGFLTSCSFDYLSTNFYYRMYILVFFTSAWVIPFGLITFAYVSILIIVFGSKKLLKNNNKNRESARHMTGEQRKRQELRLTFMVFLVIVVWFVAWTPYAVVALLGIFGKHDVITPLVSMAPALFCKTASCLDPFLYALIHPRFQAELKNMFCKSRKRPNNKAMKMWTTESRRRSNTRKITFTENSEEFDETSMFEDQSAQVPSWKKISVIKEVISDDDLQKDKTYKPVWWYKPCFSNRTSSLRSLARTLSNLDKRVKMDDMSNSV